MLRSENNFQSQNKIGKLIFDLKIKIIFVVDQNHSELTSLASMWGNEKTMAKSKCHFILVYKNNNIENRQGWLPLHTWSFSHNIQGAKALPSY